MEGQNLGGVEIVDGGCTLFMHDNHGYNITHGPYLKLPLCLRWFPRLPVTSTVVSETPVVPPLVSDPPVEEIGIVEPDPPVSYNYPPGTVLISLNTDTASEAQARGIAQRYTVKSGTAKSSFTGYHSTVQEGGIFRVRLDMEGQNLGGVEIVDGGCTLFMHDNHGYNITHGNVLNSQTFATTHDNHDDDGRTASVSILSCNLPDLDREGIRYEIDRNNGNHQAVVQITTAGSTGEEIDDGVYTLTIANLQVEGSRHYFDFVIDKEPPTAVNYWWYWAIVYHDVPAEREPPAGGFRGLYRHVNGDWRYSNGNYTRMEFPTDGEDNTYEWWHDMRWWPADFDKTLTVTVTRLQKRSMLRYGESCGGPPQCYYTPPGGTYLVGNPRTLTITIPAAVGQ